MRKVILAVRALDGCSPAALRVLLRHGPGAARKILGATLREASYLKARRVVNWLDLIRMFSVEEELILNGAGWYDGSTTPTERVLIAQLVRYFKPKAILEVGTYRGDTTRLLVEHLPAGGTVYSVDLPAQGDFSNVKTITDVGLVRARAPDEAYRGHRRASDIKQVLGNTFDPGTWAAVPENIELAFIDASHSYEAVRNDTEWVRRKAAKDAVILWHDYFASASPENGVGKYIREQMKVHDDIFVCSGTTMAMRIPVRFLLEGAKRVRRFFADGDSGSPEAILPWLL